MGGKGVCHSLSPDGRSAEEPLENHEGNDGPSCCHKARSYHHQRGVVVEHFNFLHLVIVFVYEDEGAVG